MCTFTEINGLFQLGWHFRRSRSAERPRIGYEKRTTWSTLKRIIFLDSIILLFMYILIFDYNNLLYYYYIIIVYVINIDYLARSSLYEVTYFFFILASILYHYVLLCFKNLCGTNCVNQNVSIWNKINNYLTKMRVSIYAIIF